MLQFKSYASGSKGNLYSLGDGKTSLLLEAGIPIRRLREYVFLYNHLACIVTHEHADHSKAVPNIQHAGIDCYMSLGTAVALGIENNYRTKIVIPGKLFKVGTWSIMPFNVKHDAKEPIGFLIINGDGERCLFMTDTCYTKNLFPGCQIMAIECAYCEEVLEANPAIQDKYKTRMMKTHFGLHNVLEMFRANNLDLLEKVYLLHLSDQHSDEDLMKKKVQEVVGDKVEVNVC